jgi:hypothetical protein
MNGTSFNICLLFKFKVTTQLTNVYHYNLIIKSYVQIKFITKVKFYFVYVHNLWFASVKKCGYYNTALALHVHKESLLV